MNPTGQPPFVTRSPTLEECRHALFALMDVINWRKVMLDTRATVVLTRLDSEKRRIVGYAVGDSLLQIGGPPPASGFPASIVGVKQGQLVVKVDKPTVPPPASALAMDGDDDFWNQALNDVPDILPGLSKEQSLIWKQVMDGKSVFITGPAGTGKTYLLNVLISELKKKLSPSSIYVTASTGVAATHVSGTTIHNFAGIGIDLDENWGVAVKHISDSARARWKSCKVLIIDEISMVNAKLFDKLDFMARNIRNRRDVPFGGIQVLVCGDFFQLPPVYKETKAEKARKAAARKASRERANDCFDSYDDSYGDSEEVEVNDAAKFAFEPTKHNSWAKVFGKNQFTLTTSFRQKDDTFVDILNNIRKGNISPEDFCRLNACVETVFPRGIKPIHLSPHRNTADEHNKRELGKLTTQAYTYDALDTPDTPDMSDMLDKNTLAMKKLVLKLGAQVLLLKNLDVGVGLVNGARGKIIAMSDEVADDDSEDEDSMDCDEVNEKQEDAVARDIKRKLRTKKAKKGDPSWPELPAYFKTKGFETIPLVRFEKKTPECPDGLLKWIIPQEFSLTSGEITIAQRTQLPLILGYAVTIHKSQGMTLKYAQIDVKEVFAPGQAYVAFSRVESIEGLKITERFEEHVIHAHPKAIAYQLALESGRFEVE